MSEPNAKLSGADADEKELQKFEIDKTHQALFEGGKSLGTSFLTYLSLLSLTTLLVFGNNIGGPEGVAVPLLGLKVTRELAAAISLLLCYVVAIWLLSLQVLTGSLTTRLCNQLNIRYERITFESWYLQYPSPFHSIQFLINSFPEKQSTLVAWVVYYAYSAVSAFLPVYLSLKISQTANFPPAWKSTWSVTTTILNACVLFATTAAALALRKNNQEAQLLELRRSRLREENRAKIESLRKELDETHELAKALLKQKLENESKKNPK